MPRLAILTHQYDQFSKFDRTLNRHTSGYLLHDIAGDLQARGWEIVVIQGVPARRPRADAAILHVDATVTPPDYFRFAQSFPLCLNLKAVDISKRTISDAGLSRDDPWDGPVIVKSNLNHFGHPEKRLNLNAEARGKARPFPDAQPLDDYLVYDSRQQVPAQYRDNPHVVIEKFVAERDPDGFAIRVWNFCGDSGWCKRYVSSDPLIKGPGILRHEPALVPDILRERRKTLGLEYGKFDFVVHNGQAILLDANKTLGRGGVVARARSMVAALPHLSVAEGDQAAESFFKGEVQQLADGLEALIDRARTESKSAWRRTASLPARLYAAMRNARCPKFRQSSFRTADTSIRQWDLMAHYWPEIGPPLRPSREDLVSFQGAVTDWTLDNRDRQPRALILGVTPELYDLSWPRGSVVKAVDRAPRMIEHVWPGERSDAVVADWRNLGLPDQSMDIVLCDGGWHLLDPSGQQQLAHGLARLIEPGGLFVTRLFRRPKDRESPADVMAALREGSIPDLNQLKLRLGMSLQNNTREGVALQHIWLALRAKTPSWKVLADSLGWRLEHLQAIDAYRHADARYHFMSQDEVAEILCNGTGGAFCLRTESFGTYALSELCPTLVFRRTSTPCH